MATRLDAIAERLFAGVMAPLVLGGAIRPGHAIGARAALALGDRPASGGPRARGAGRRRSLATGAPARPGRHAARPERGRMGPRRGGARRPSIGQPGVRPPPPAPRERAHPRAGRGGHRARPVPQRPWARRSLVTRGWRGRRSSRGRTRRSGGGRDMPSFSAWSRRRAFRPGRSCAASRSFARRFRSSISHPSPSIGRA